jgi:4-cresol dehydrogenase (hydroxylating)
VLTTRDQWTKEPGALSDSVIKAIRDRYKVGWWGVSLRLYGRESVNKAAYGVLEDAMNRLKPMSLRPTAWKRGEPLEYSGWTGTPITFPMQNANWHGGRGGHIGFSAVLPQSGSAAMAQFKRTYERYREYGMDYQASFAFGERHLINVNAVLLNKDDPAMMMKVDPFLHALVADAKAHGYGEYRTHLDYMDLVASTYDFNDHALRKLNERVKTALDPTGVIAPGKSGIWPASARRGAA